MTGIWALAALWVGLALIATLLSIWLRISSALSEIVVGTIAQLKANSIACRDSQANVELRFVNRPQPRSDLTLASTPGRR